MTWKTHSAAILAGVVAAGSIAALGTGVSHAETHASPIQYVALGDSAAAGPLVAEQDSSAPGCLRSLDNYPSVVAQRLDAHLTDVTCSSARSANVTDTAQSTFSGQVPPQETALGPDTDLVTITIGANDISLFPTVLSCVNPLPEPTGTSCRDKFTAGGVDQQRQLVENASAGWSSMLESVRDRAPSARIVVIGYGTYIAADGCPGTQPFWPRDADYLQSVIDYGNTVMAATAARHGVEYIDITEATAGHDICTDPATAYYTGIVPTQPAVPLHPTAAGMQAIGKTVADALS
ncbi:SGNH/GDSL hydrolase family protein [Rhodococcus erythropolis]|uniref:SGNH/GDSL hydrolase family protein n=1 Tax=Rhodococcus TaxID=1827 RepID=UPI000698AC67|nr:MULTISPECIES: SGNH/GDSL hydrolase family protein [Rhodococcus]MCS4253753.1 lysophospholipase L1-like esterase [Rhodococcus erythropolis]MCW2297810.1 lysophospholipase L1-like esterase [Rhodococcus erythropolis]MCW2427208.1 lysophospholipase L1-like esterase [Rhodococcus erythropolis]MDI9904373.1 SGNH/GDSL hydrolase family protein [Rhodococcus sp. IEGM 1406]MDJ0012010.1 SGNH/GDSL hydrolase family protein [Rhodococcus erythropolis]